MRSKAEIMSEHTRAIRSGKDTLDAVTSVLQLEVLLDIRELLQNQHMQMRAVALESLSDVMKRAMHSHYEYNSVVKGDSDAS